MSVRSGAPRPESAIGVPGARLSYRAAPIAVPDLAAVAARIAAGSGPWFWLDAGAGAEAGRSYLGVSSTIVSATQEEGITAVRVAGVEQAVPGSGDLHERVESVLASWELTAAEVPEEIFGGGWVGYLGYEYGSLLVGTPAIPGPLPLAQWQLVEHMLCVDHVTQTAWHVWAEGSAAWSVVADLSGEEPAAGARLPEPQRVSATPPAAHWRHDAQSYLRLIADAQEHIREGDIYQICLTNQAVVPGRFDALAVHSRLRELSPAPHGALLHFPGLSVVSSSPETFLRVTTSGTVTTRPIKGTRPRGVDPVQDGALALQLQRDVKERAENLMIVDLMRNDLTRIAVPGTVSVSGLLEVESYASVHQLVSTVEADLAPGYGIAELLRVSFPAGSMTGTPKRRAMELIAAAEGGARGAYAGCFGYRDARGSAQLAMLIRSVVLDHEGAQATIGAGGGITILSDSEAEVAEVQLKARALLAALGNVSAPATNNR